MALCFFKHTSFLDCPGVVEVPVDLVLEEVVKFTIPCILKIMDDEILLGGWISKHHVFVWQEQCTANT
jgi:hypothetical protein